MHIGTLCQVINETTKEEKAARKIGINLKIHNGNSLQSLSDVLNRNINKANREGISRLTSDKTKTKIGGYDVGTSSKKDIARKVGQHQKVKVPFGSSAYRKSIHGIVSTDNPIGDTYGDPNRNKQFKYASIQFDKELDKRK